MSGDCARAGAVSAGRRSDFCGRVLLQDAQQHAVSFEIGIAGPSKEITGIINGYEQRITKNDRLYLWLRAARDVTYADGHHELEQVNLQVFPPTGDKPDQIVSDRSIYDQKSGLLQFNGNVQIEYS